MEPGGLPALTLSAFPRASSGPQHCIRLLGKYQNLGGSLEVQITVTLHISHEVGAPGQRRNIPPKNIKSIFSDQAEIQEGRVVHEAWAPITEKQKKKLFL